MNPIEERSSLSDFSQSRFLILTHGDMLKACQTFNLRRIVVFFRVKNVCMRNWLE
jgi:hypothetical protein